MRDAIVFLHDEFDAPDTGSLRGDYAALAARVRSSASRGGTTLMPRLLGEAVNDPELFAIFRANLVEPRRAALRDGARAGGRPRRDPRGRSTSSWCSTCSPARSSTGC